MLSGVPLPTKPKKASRPLKSKLRGGVGSSRDRGGVGGGSHDRGGVGQVKDRESGGIGCPGPFEKVGQQGAQIQGRGGLGSSGERARVEQIHDQIVDAEVGLGRRRGGYRANCGRQKRPGGRGQTDCRTTAEPGVS